ncbi:hypothetical protein QR685DRAFT_541629 [Neurospora intermedia]|uniref:Uncharacterized protein n=1 Tax=Neurospora intermedia TaxID=5142 RepID=A0ABR3DJU2_NEUIN
MGARVYSSVSDDGNTDFLWLSETYPSIRATGAVRVYTGFHALGNANLKRAVFKELDISLNRGMLEDRLDRANSITKPPYPRPLRRQVLTTFLVVADVPKPLAPGDETPDKHRHSSNWQARRLQSISTTLAKRMRRRWVPLLGFPFRPSDRHSKVVRGPSKPAVVMLWNDP